MHLRGVVANIPSYEHVGIGSIPIWPAGIQLTQLLILAFGLVNKQVPGKTWERKTVATMVKLPSLRPEVTVIKPQRAPGPDRDEPQDTHNAQPYPIVMKKLQFDNLNTTLASQKG